MKESALIKSVVKNGFCCGCGICESIAPEDHIVMMFNASGYLRPVILQSLCDGDEFKIAATCPGVCVKQDAGAKRDHFLWGKLCSVMTGFSTDAEIRWKGSSGGVISALACHLLEQKCVDFVAQIAVSKNDPLINETHISRTREDVLRAAGSRYAPVAPLRSLRDLLETGKQFAFIGRPCDVAALRQYARLDPRVDRQVSYMLSFMCAGIPSMKGTLAILETLGVNREQIVSLRYRGNGWPGLTKVVLKDGRSFQMEYSVSWGTILNKHLQFRCKICPDSSGEFADIVCADAWYGKDGYPDFTEEEGRSLILTRTTKGEALVRDAVDSGALSVANFPLDKIASIQPYQVKHKKTVFGRVLATRLKKGTAPAYQHLGLLPAYLRANPMEWVRDAYGTFLRAGMENQ